MLSGEAIAQAVKDGLINIEPFDHTQLGPNSYDLRLGDEIKTYTVNEFVCKDTGINYLDTKESNASINYTIPKDGMILMPKILYLGHTKEIAGSDYYIPCIEGRSSIARLGIFTHFVAGFGDAGFLGQWTLEISVIHPVKIYSGMRICQIYFESIEGAVSQLYNGKYKNSRGVIASKLYKDKDLE